MDLASQLRAMPQAPQSPAASPLPRTREGSEAEAWQQAARVTLLSSRVRISATPSVSPSKQRGRQARRRLLLTPRFPYCRPQPSAWGHTDASKGSCHTGLAGLAVLEGRPRQSHATGMHRILVCGKAISRPPPGADAASRTASVAAFRRSSAAPAPWPSFPLRQPFAAVFGRRAWTATNRVERCSSNRQTQTPHTAAPSEYLCGSRHQQARCQAQCRQLNCPGLWPPSRGLSALRTRRRSAVSLQPLQRRGLHTCEQLLDVVARGLSWEHAQPHMDLNFSCGHGCDSACELCS